MLLLSKEDIRQVFSMKDAIEANKTAFRLVAEGRCDTPLRTLIPSRKDDAGFLFMPAYAGELDTAAIKIVNQFPHNIEKGLPSSPAMVLLIDGNTGFIVAVLDGTYVTQVRTGAASGAAFDVLAKKDCRIGALIGTGGQAAAQLEAMLAARPLEEARVYSRNYDRVRAFTDRMQKELEAYGTRIVPARTSDEAIEGADLLITATPSETPVFDGTKIKKGATLSCVGAYQYKMQELDPALLPRVGGIYFDSQEAVLAESGDILQPLDQGIITKDDLTGNLGDVINGKLPGRTDDDEIIVFETVGVGAQDLVAAKAIYDRALAAGAGTNWG